MLPSGLPIPSDLGGCLCPLPVLPQELDLQLEPHSRQRDVRAAPYFFAPPAPIQISGRPGHLGGRASMNLAFGATWRSKHMTVSVGPGGGRLPQH